ncbi:class I SAM-dependent methyltransferase family protein [Candidatus Woesearchaeota archaeon]|nr:class I SAM-dependent methyltransferase family protein [Candidatus Woesearchaeota archaeon]
MAIRARRGFDSIGDIAILEIPRELAKRELKIAQAFRKQHPYFRVVAKKLGQHRGPYRIQRIKVLTGERRTWTLHRESGLALKVDMNTAYFSPRLSSERLRIASLVKPGERVLVLFSGVGPYMLVVAKRSKAEEVVGVELNPAAHRFALENIALNGLQDRARAIEADAKRWCLRTRERFDRIIMPLPMTASAFLPAALRVAKKGATVHFYQFAHEDAFQFAANTALDVCERLKRSCSIIRIVKVGQQSPHVYRVSVDFRVR